MAAAARAHPWCGDTNRRAAQGLAWRAASTRCWLSATLTALAHALTLIPALTSALTLTLTLTRFVPRCRVRRREWLRPSPTPRARVRPRPRPS